VELAGGVPQYLMCSAEHGFALDMDGLRSMINPKTRAIILNSPSNPTGAAYSRADLVEASKLALEHGFYIITDDIYDEIRFDSAAPENAVSVNPEGRDRVLVVNGVSKTYAMTGWRIGYMAGPEAVVKATAKIQSQSTSNPNSIAQKAAVAALSGPQDCIQIMKKAFAERKEYIIGRLRAMEDVKCVDPSGAFYAFPDMSAFYGKNHDSFNISDSLSLADYLLESAQIACVPGIAFGDDRFIRFSYATDMAVIKEGMDRLEKALEKLE
jgi:aspartate aminotransferase